MMSNKHYHGVLFDLDGTLVDTAEDFILCLNQLRAQESLPPLAADLIRTVVSDGARAMIALAFNIKEGDMEFEEKKQAFLDLYLNNIARSSRLFNGLASLLNWCQQAGIPWGIVTNKPRLYAEPLLAALNLEQSMGTLVCPQDVKNSKPDPEPMLKACSEISLAPQKCLYVGDHIRDIQAGKNANMPTIAAAYGYLHHKDEAKEWQADWTVNTSKELCDLLMQLLTPAKPASHKQKNET